MIFSFGIRKVTDAHQRYWEYVDAHSQLKVLKDREENKEVVERLKKAMKQLDKVISIKRKEYNKEVSDLEAEFIKDVFDNEELYKRKLEK